MASQKNKKLSTRQLESYLQDLDEFDEPKVELEQYATPPHIAATILSTVDHSFDDLEGKLVADLGCGTGRLTVGSIMCGAKMVVGFDIDSSALNCALQNISDVLSGDESQDDDTPVSAYLGCRNFNLIQADVGSESYDEFFKPWSKFFDTVIMNPPFGTKNNQGLDVRFLKRAIDLAQNTVYSLHKTSTRAFILNKSQQWRVQAKPVAQIRYNLNNTYKFHRKASVDVDVDLWQIKCFE